MKMLPRRLSVVIPCYNQGHYLYETVSSFPAYHEQDTYDVIIVDDGSTDAFTLEVLRDLEQKGFQIIQQVNQGLCSARNTGIRHSGSEYILPLDGDDKLSEELIYESIDILDKDPSVCVVYSDGEYFGAKNGPWIVGEFNLQRLMLWNFMHASAVFRKSAWEKTGGYDTNLNYMGFEDWDLWLSIASMGGRFHYIPKNYFSYRISDGSMVSRFTAEKYKVLQDFIHQKHAALLGADYISGYLSDILRANTHIWINIFLFTTFPKLFEKLRVRGLIKTTSAF